MSDPTVDPPAIVQSAEKDEAWDIHVKAAVGFGLRGGKSMSQAGAELLKAKMACPPGMWLKSLAKHGVARRTAYRWLESFRLFPEFATVATLNQFVESLGVASHEEQEIAHVREQGDEPEEHPALKIVLCKTCRRKGAIRDCKDCLAERSKFVGKKGSGKRSKGGKNGTAPKGGGSLFDWKDYDLVASRFYRLPEKVVKVYPAEADSAPHKRAKELLTELAELLKTWRASIQGAK